MLDSQQCPLNREWEDILSISYLTSSDEHPSSTYNSGNKGSHKGRVREVCYGYGTGYGMISNW